MFELKVLFVNKIEWTVKDTGEKRCFYRVWVSLPDGSGAYVTSSKPFAAGDTIKLGLRASTNRETQGLLQVFTI